MGSGSIQDYLIFIVYGGVSLKRRFKKKKKKRKRK